jgi:hypothetical protein
MVYGSTWIQMGPYGEPKWKKLPGEMKKWSAIAIFVQGLVRGDVAGITRYTDTHHKHSNNHKTYTPYKHYRIHRRHKQRLNTNNKMHIKTKHS